MARNTPSGTSPMSTITAGFVGLLVVAVVVVLGPVLAGSMEQAVPEGTCTYADNETTFRGECGSVNSTSHLIYSTPYDAVSQWNPTYNTDIPSGEAMWTTNVVIGGIVILVFFVALAVYYIRVIA